MAVLQSDKETTQLDFNRVTISRGTAMRKVKIGSLTIFIHLLIVVQITARLSQIKSKSIREVQTIIEFHRNKLRNSINKKFPSHTALSGPPEAKEYEIF